MPMSTNKSECDVKVILGALAVFALPLTLLIPNFSVWDMIPKVRVTRFHVLSQELTWSQSNAVIIGLLSLFFCLYLEIRKRKLDDMVENVLTVSQATEGTMEAERERTAATMRACVRLLDTSVEHYENLMLLQDEMRKRYPMNQLPPAIEASGSDI